LHNSHNEEIGIRWIVDGELANVGDEGKTFRSVDPVNPNDIGSAKLRTDKRDQYIASSSMKATSIAPPIPTMKGGSPLANVVTSPVVGLTREILPTTPSVTNRSPPGPMVLPDPPSSPDTSSWGGWAAKVDGAPFAIELISSGRPVFP
jgi:hypothetical protein